MSIRTKNTSFADLKNSVVQIRRVLFALMLRDIKTRFFGSGLGYIMYVAWPFAHLVVVVAMFAFAGRVAPFGDNAYLYIASGALPFMCFSYTSRFIMLSYVTNRPLLSFPAVRALDIVFARALLEALTASLVVILVIVSFFALGINPLPYDVEGALSGLLMSILLGVGSGMISAIIAPIFPFYMTLYVLIVIVLWAASGVVFVPDSLPEAARYVLSFNPILHCIIWVRAAYYPNYGSLTFDKIYLEGWVLGTFVFGLALERLVRGRLLEG